MLANERGHVGGPFHASQTRIEDQPCHACGGLNFSFQNVPLEWEEQALFEQFGRHLIGDCLRRLDELIRDMLSMTF
jgi:hypothetical protein